MLFAAILRAFVGLLALGERRRKYNEAVGERVEKEEINERKEDEAVGGRAEK